MPSSRREILQTLTAAVPVGIAGCAFGGAFPSTDRSTTSPTATPAPTSTPPATPESTPPVNTGGIGVFDPSSIHNWIEIGSREGVKEEFKPHDIRIWNTLSSERTVFVRILDRLAKTTVHRAEYTIPADEGVRITLLTPSKYYVQLWGPAINPPETLLVPCRHFDCNESSIDIGFFESGEVRSAVFSTLVACQHPEC